MPSSHCQGDQAASPERPGGSGCVRTRKPGASSVSRLFPGTRRFVHRRSSLLVGPRLGANAQVRGILLAPPPLSWGGEGRKKNHEIESN